MNLSDKFTKATTTNPDFLLGISEIADKLDSKNAKLTVLFISNEYDLKPLSTAQIEKLGENVIACTTAGEIGLNGYNDHSISCVAFHGDSFVVDTILINDLKNFSHGQAQGLKDNYFHIKEQHREILPIGKCFSILLIDGLSVKEEITAGIIASAIENTPLIGGSAGDGLNFGSTKILTNGEFVENAASLTFVTTTEPFEVFKVQHFSNSENKIVITESHPELRIVNEIDGLPAAESYAETLGLEIADLNPTIFSKNPLMLKIGNDYYVRSVQKVNDDHSLTFYCAIDDGLVLTLAKRESLVENIGSLFNRLQSQLGEISQCLLFECILRKLEVADMPDSEQKKIIDLYTKNNSIGFHTYGEQFGGIHINQTLTGVAFGQKK